MARINDIDENEVNCWQGEKLKALGFDVPCLKKFDHEGFVNYTPKGYGLYYENWNKGKYTTSCPTQAQVVEWLRTTHKIFVSVRLTDISERKFNYAASIWFFNEKEQGCIDEYSSKIDAKAWRVDSPQKAYSLAFDWIFNNYKF